jgi:serine/threonine-protein kinase RsbW
MSDSDRLSVTLPSAPGNLPLVRHAIRGFLDASDVADPPAGEVLLAVTEACANVVQHAYVGDPEPGAIELPVIASLTDRLEIRPTPGSGTEIMMAFALNEAA